MKSVNIKFSNVKTFLSKATKNLGALFFVFFLLLLLFEVFEINTSVQILLNVNQETAIPPSKDKGVRINFDNYNQVVNKIQNGAAFTPTDGITKNPFQATH